MGRGAHPGDLHTRLHYVIVGRSAPPLWPRRSVREARDELPGRRRLHVLRPSRAHHARAGDDRHGRRDPARGQRSVLFRAEPVARLLPASARLSAGLVRARRLSRGARRLRSQPAVQDRIASGEAPGRSTPRDRGDPARMRAIPNNAILQQFGYIANVVAGLGAAVGADRDRFAKLAQVIAAPADAA